CGTAGGRARWSSDLPEERRRRATRPIASGEGEKTRENAGVMDWRFGSVGRRVAVDVAARPGAGGAAGVEAGVVGGEAAARGPGPQPLDRLARGDRHRDDVLGRLEQADAEQVRRLAAGLDLGPGPVAVAGAALIGVE